MKLPTVSDSPPAEHPVRLPGVTKLKAEYRAFVQELAFCETQEQLDFLVIGARVLLQRIRLELTDWWDGDFWNGDGFEPDNSKGLRQLIDNKRKELSNASARE